MKILEQGHKYQLASLDNDKNYLENVIFFVKRVGEGYPGNKGEPHHGTNCQEVLRVLIDHTKYLNNQIYDSHNLTIIGMLQGCLYEFEERAAIRHKRQLSFDFTQTDNIEFMPTCSVCGHIECNLHAKNTKEELAG